uniref:Uncharacterized protein n=1 Tax=Magnetospirillum gryphiswaldense TaxID=55518 RepID=A4TY43_9PROT|nr:hypothetical protein MGR_2365 [Magnetospirillum gryphiswaldense MSR-1]
MSDQTHGGQGGIPENTKDVRGSRKRRPAQPRWMFRAG